MDSVHLVAELEEIKDLLAVAVNDHPEDYNLEHTHRKVTRILEEFE